MSSIVCAIDFSPASLQAFGIALDIAHRADAAMTLLYAVDWVADEQPSDDIGGDVADIRDAMTGRADERLRALSAGDSSIEDRVKTRIVLGRAHRRILEVAHEEHADLIVMGAQGRGGLALALLGSTTEQVIRSAACPVLTVGAPIV